MQLPPSAAVAKRKLSGLLLPSAAFGCCCHNRQLSCRTHKAVGTASADGHMGYSMDFVEPPQIEDPSGLFTTLKNMVGQA